MVVCGPCVMMLPSNNSFPIRETRIPLPTNFSFNHEKTRIPSKLPSNFFPTKKEGTIRQQPSTSTLENSRVDRLAKESVNSGHAKNNRKISETIPNPKPRKAESLVLANGRGKYVGIKPLSSSRGLKPSAPKPLTHSPSVLSKPKPQVKSSNPPKRKREFSSSSIKSEKLAGDRREAFRVRDPVDKAELPAKRHYLASSNIGDQSGSFYKANAIGDPSQNVRNTIQSNKTRIPTTIPVSASNLPVMKSKNLISESIIPRSKRNTNQQLSVSRHSSYEDENNFGSSEGKQTTYLCPDIFDIKYNSNLNKLKPQISQCSLPPKSLKYSNFCKPTKKNHLIKENTNYDALNKSTAKALSDKSNSGDIEERNNSIELTTSSDTSGYSSEMCEFSFASGEALVPEDQTDHHISFSQLISDEEEEEEEDSKEKLTVINMELMERSGDTVLDASLDSFDEEISSETPEPDCCEKQDDVMIISEFSENSEKSSDSSEDDFLLQSFRKLQKEVQRTKSEFDELRSNSNFASVTQPSIQQTSETEKQKSSTLDECDYIEIDCDVQPMAALNRPLVYGYGYRLPLRTWNIHQRQRHSVNFDNTLSNNKFSENFHLPSSLMTPEESATSNTFNETYWDYYLAKQKNKGITKEDSMYSIPNKTTRASCPSGDFYYDPEVLLAQVSHPKSLQNATFSEYSSHIKSSIMARLVSQYSGESVSDAEDLEYGSCLELAEKTHPITYVDPGYSSESDVTKIKSPSYSIRSHTPRYSFEKGNKHDKCNPTYQTSSRRKYALYTDSLDYLRLTPSNSFLNLTNNSFNTSNDAEKELLEESKYCYRYSPNSCTPAPCIGENPWLHLLPDVTPPRTPLQEIVECQTESKTKMFPSPSVTSLPVLSSTSQDTDLENKTFYLKEMKYIHRPIRSKSSDASFMQEGLTEQKKSLRKSFLPTFFRKKSRKSAKLLKTGSQGENDFPQTFGKHIDVALPCVPAPVMNLPKYQGPTEDEKQSKRSQNSQNFLSAYITKKSGKRTAASLTLSEKSSSSSSSSSGQSNRSASSQDSVLTVVPVRNPVRKGSLAN